MNNYSIFLLTLILSSTRSQNESINQEILTENGQACVYHNQTKNFKPQVSIDCPKVHPAIYITYEKDTKVTVECNNTSEAYLENYHELFPNFDLQINEVIAVDFQNCPFIQNTSIKSILRQIGIRNVKTLSFTMYEVNQQNPTFKNFEKLDSVLALDMPYIGIIGLPPNVFDDLQNLKSLNLGGNEMSLPEGIFDKLENLMNLELVNNNLKSIDGLLRNLTKLTSLTLSSNQINLNKESFRGAESLTHLDLKSNKISTLDYDVFSSLPNLIRLNLGGNEIKAFPERLLENNKKLQEFIMTHNSVAIKELSSDIFWNLPELWKIWISCGLKTISKDIFRGTKNIEWLSLVDNALSSLPTTLFEGQTQLRHLDLSSNQIKELDDDVFKVNAQLRHLYLSNNNMETISRSLFRHQKKLEELRMNNNKLHSIDHFAFFACESLKTVNLANNLLNFTEDNECVSPFHNNLKLENLNLRYNNITTICNDWKQSLIGLKELDLSHNKIQILNSVDLQFNSKNIETVYLTHNEISTINFRGLSYVAENTRNSPIEVFVEDNPIICDCHLVDYHRYLKNATIAELKYVSIKKDSTCVEPLLLKGTIIKEMEENEFVCEVGACPQDCHCTERPFDRTLIVNCSNMNLTQVPPLFSADLAHYKVVELFIENNQIEKLPSVQEDHLYRVVTKIHAKNNLIANIDVENLPENLTILDFSANKITSFTDSVINSLRNNEKLVELNLEGNELTCTCDTKGFVGFLREIAKKIHGDAKCADGTNVNTVSFDASCNAFFISISIGLAAIAFFVAAITFVYYKYHLEIKLWMFSHNLLQKLITEENIDKDKTYDAFVSYSEKDSEFVENLVEKLEQEPLNYKTCVHTRDWIVGDMITDQIQKSIDTSRRTIIVLTDNFLESRWARIEFITAYLKQMEERTARIIVILHGNIENMENLSTEMQLCLKTRTYIKSDDIWFWEKIRQAMPHPSKVEAKTTDVELAQAIQMNGKHHLVPNGKLSNGNLNGHAQVEADV